MKKIIIKKKLTKKISVLIIGLVMVFPMITNAATFVVSPSTGSYTTGDVITLAISVDPAGNTIYTAKLDSVFSIDTFEIVSFTINDEMLPLKQPGYDALDNTTGVLIKTGGYVGGVTTVTPFGQLVLLAKEAGKGALTINDASMLLDSNSIDQQNGNQILTFNVIAPVVEPVIAAPTVTTSSQETTITEVVTENSKDKKDEVQDQENQSEDIDTHIFSSQLAAIGNIALVNNKIFQIILLAIILITIFWYFIWKRQK